MPQTITIAAFVLGSVLLLIALLGGSFKIFNAEVASPVGNLLRLSAFLLSLFFFLVSFLSVFVELPKPPRPETTSASGAGAPATPSLPSSTETPASELPPPQTPTVINLSGYWRDSLGTVYLVTQSGSEIEFVGNNVNNGMQSYGTGTISGNELTVDFTTSYQATGNGRATISENGKKLTGRYEDSVYGTYSTVSWKIE